MNEQRLRVPLGKKKIDKDFNPQYGFSGYIKPCGKFWKRFFNKKVRKGSLHKRGNWFEWS